MRMQEHAQYSVHLFVNRVTASSLSRPTRTSRSDCIGNLKELCMYERSDQ
jgi:hypothetical protein